MEIHVSNNKLRKAFENEAECKKRYGADMATKIFIRLGALRAADSLVTFWPPKNPPERCHELGGDLAGLFSIDLKQPYRLLFKPVTPRAPDLDEQEYWQTITAIEIHSIEDTHG
jgi:plasmid maintenance system killer protein